jgi:hypothetical protein
VYKKREGNYFSGSNWKKTGKITEMYFQNQALSNKDFYHILVEDKKCMPAGRQKLCLW